MPRSPPNAQPEPALSPRWSVASQIRRFLSVGSFRSRISQSMPMATEQRIAASFSPTIRRLLPGSIACGASSVLAIRSIHTATIRIPLSERDGLACEPLLGRTHWRGSFPIVAQIKCRREAAFYGSIDGNAAAAGAADISSRHRAIFWGASLSDKSWPPLAQCSRETSLISTSTLSVGQASVSAVI